MTTLEAIRIALQSLWANKLRSILTLLGVVIGVAAVIAVVTFVNGINGYVAEKIFNLGADVFIISKISPVITNIDQFLEGEKRKDLTMEDYQAVLEACKHCTMVPPPSIRTATCVMGSSRLLTAGFAALHPRWRRSLTSISPPAACSTNTTRTIVPTQR
jgi:putative ABC transport system permease protein